MTPEEADAMQEWKGMDGASAFLIIQGALFRMPNLDQECAAREMMNAWLRANQGLNE